MMPAQIKQVLCFLSAAIAGIWAFSPATAAQKRAPKLSIPIDCTINDDCWIQNLVDFDSGPNWQDPFCGRASFNKHKGTDFRLRYLSDLQRNVMALAMAPGTVLALRNDMEENLVTGPNDVSAVKGKECGNGALIAHKNGWTTQYCHLAKNSLMVKKGDKVKRSQPIGKIGLSGHTTFPHVHVTVRKGKTIIDPMTGLARTARCNKQKGLNNKTLWDAKAKARIHGASTALLGAGFSAAPVKSAQILEGQIKQPTGSGPLIFYANFINLQTGDRIDLIIKGPNGIYVASRGKPIRGSKANWTVYTGKRRGIVKGATYQGSAILYRNNKPFLIKKNVTIRF